MSEKDRPDDSFFDVSGLPGEDRETEDPLMGTELDGRYRLERLLGEGGMGKVYAGTQLSVDREVAIKLLRSETLVQREVKERFLREAKLISGFNHPNIVRLIDFGEDADRQIPYLVMELVGGVSLGELTRRGRLALPLALEICYQVCGALMQAHSAGIVHRDLKPENLKLLPVVGDSFQVKVLDFGIAFPRDANSRLTSTGMICGTAYYIAPEQARAWELDGRADLYALGILLFEMLSGHLPFRGDSDFQIMLMQVQKPPPSLSRFVPPEEVPAPVVELVHALLEKDPTARPESARAVRERIDRIRRECDIAPLDLDLEEASAEAFDRWLLPPDEDPALVEATTAIDPTTPAEALEKLADQAELESSPSAALRKQGAPDSKVETNEPDQAQAASDADKSEPGGAVERRPDQPTVPSAPARSRNRGWLIVAACALLAVGAWALASEYNQKRAATHSGEQAAAPDEDSDAEPDDSQPAAAVPMSAFAGACSVLGDSDSWFHTLFLHPEVGEVLLWGDQRLVWSPIDIDEHLGETLQFSYDHPERDQPEQMRANKSGERLVFRSDETSKFVCRIDADHGYFDTLEASGPYVAVGDDEATLEVAGSGQRLTAGEASYVYRVLDGSDLAGGVVLAVREAADREAPWATWELELDEDAGQLRVTRDDERTDYLTPEQHRADRQAAQQRKARAAAIKKPNPPARPPTPAPAEPKEASSQEQASAEKVAHYRKKVEKLGDRCAKYMGKIKANIAHLETLQEEKRYDELKEFSKTVQVENQRYSDMLRTIGKEYSQLMTEITLSSMNRAQMVGLSSIYTNKCSWD